MTPTGRRATMMALGLAVFATSAMADDGPLGPRAETNLTPDQELRCRMAEQAEDRWRTVSPYDPLSIMNYTLPPEVLGCPESLRPKSRPDPSLEPTDPSPSDATPD